MMKANNVYYLKSLALRDSKFMHYRKRYIFDNRYLRITEDPSEGPLSESQVLPDEYNMSQSKFIKQNAKAAPITPTPSPYTQDAAPTLSISEQQTSVNKLFGM